MSHTNLAHDLIYMQRALEQAKLAEINNEVPVGAVLIHEHTIIAEAYNAPIMYCDPSAHAEINVLRQAAKKLHNYRLIDTTLYVTLEPCLMCAGALIQARITRLVFGAVDPKTGAFGGAINIYANNKWNHILQITSGVLAPECGQILKDFFRQKR